MTLYDVLGVAPDADEAALRRAYVALARRHHPDVAGGDTVRMRAVNAAWATLGDPVRRAAYDRSLLPPTTTAPRVAAAPASADPDDWWDDDLDDDDRPVRVTVRLPGWVSMVPVGLLALAAGSFVVGLVLVSKPLLSLALMCVVLSFVFFLAAPFIALFAARTGDRPNGSAQ